MAAIPQDKSTATRDAVRVDVVDLHDRNLGEAALNFGAAAVTHSRTQPLVSVELDAQGRHFKGMGNDYYEALQQLRRQLHIHSLDLNCYGSCVNVAPSIASRDRTRGRLACRLTLGREPREDTLVDIFTKPQDALPLGTPDEQHKFLSTWRKSLVHVFKLVRIRIENQSTEDAIELLLADFMKSHVVRKEYQFDELLAEHRLRVHRSLVRAVLDELDPDKLDQLRCAGTGSSGEDQVFQIQVVDHLGSTSRELRNPASGAGAPQVIERIMAIADGSAWRLLIRSYLPARNR